MTQLVSAFKLLSSIKFILVISPVKTFPAFDTHKISAFILSRELFYRSTETETFFVQSFNRTQSGSNALIVFSVNKFYERAKRKYLLICVGLK